MAYKSSTAQWQVSGSMMLVVIIVMSVMLLSVTFVWQTVMMMHESALARQTYMYKKLAIEDLLNYARHMVTTSSKPTGTYEFAHWPLHHNAASWWRATITITILNNQYKVNALLHDAHQPLVGSCMLTTTIIGNESVCLVDAWTLAQ